MRGSQLAGRLAADTLCLPLQISGVPVEELQKYLFLLRDRDAANHLLRVSAGLDSLVMGEGQILAQVSGPRAGACPLAGSPF